MRRGGIYAWTTKEAPKDLEDLAEEERERGMVGGMDLGVLGGYQEHLLNHQKTLVFGS